MARVSINIEDQGGEMALGVVFVGGFDPKSHAHQHANLLIKHMDEIGRKLGHATIETVEKPKGEGYGLGAPTAKPALALVTSAGVPFSLEDETPMASPACSLDGQTCEACQ